MELTLDEAAARMGKSVRQIRYMMQEGRLRAVKRGGRWYVKAADLPQPAEQRERKQARLRAAVEGALDLDRAPGPRRYSLRDLRAFQIGLPLYNSAASLAGAQHPATLALERMLTHLARGCHRYDEASKLDAYRQARDEASLAACALLMRPVERAAGLVDTIEQELMPALAGLLRRIEAPRRRAAS